METAIRERQGILEAQAATLEQREAVVRTWLQLSDAVTLKNRKKRIKKEIDAWERGMDGAGLAEVRQNMLSHLERNQREAATQAGLDTPLPTPVHSDDDEEEEGGASTSGKEKAREAREQAFSERYLDAGRHAGSSAPYFSSGASVRTAATAPPAYHQTHAEWPPARSTSRGAGA